MCLFFYIKALSIFFFAQNYIVSIVTRLYSIYKVFMNYFLAVISPRLFDDFCFSENQSDACRAGMLLLTFFLISKSLNIL